ncbi:MAG: 4-hydroxythreonine-4-phosphate dehydrogenase PdxA [Gemmatimonadota bacterium]|nr:4-hydroxythreonine-4-phosphate dehydrogenase PdxA [Gemmatimonadota bacterium]
MTALDERPRLAITLGDPRGIGPEIAAAALRDPRVRESCRATVVGPTGFDLVPDEVIGAWSGGGKTTAAAPEGRSAATAGLLSALAIERAVALALAGRVDGVVTGPIDKHALLAGGYDFPGHTEMLAALTGVPVAMMLASDRLRVVLATTHIPLRAVPEALTAMVITQVAAVTRQGLRDWYGIAEPRIALCALNPHAGDSGRFGREDEELLAPAARAAGIAGPFPADTVFVRAMRGAFDAVIAPYHDVGMTAIKVASFGSAVNVTLGLPFPRTSPDHGTARDIAGLGKADPSSFIAAVLECARIAARITRDSLPPSASPPASRHAAPPPRGP